ncbi:MAG: tRNA lysidine(34) synthetase TilS [Verrucomicrobiales bacterium]|nr:tRNA lysidine(34) synthetase TilS [Verrucomicrobiales bacterium]
MGLGIRAHRVKTDGSAIEELAARLVERWDPLRPHLVAVSGGIDSMVLWHLLRSAGFRKLIVVHVDHGLRGEESTKDSEFVAAAAAGSGDESVIRHVAVAAEAKRRKQSLETMARDLRYRAIAAVAGERDCPRVFLAHHADDRIETALMHLFRGAGSRGLAGMSEESVRRVEGIDLTLIRPLLGVGRAAIMDYAVKHGLPWREDASNQSDFALRNRIRHRLLPEIEAVFGRDPREAILRAADLAALDEAWAAEMLGDLPRRGEGLDVAVLRTYPKARQSRLLLSWLRESGVPDCGFAEVALVAQILEARGRPAKGNLPGGFHVRRRAGVLFIEAPA